MFVVESLKKRIPWAYVLLRCVYKSAAKIRSRIVIALLIRSGKKLYVEFGAGDVKGKDGWYTVDMALGCDIFWDLREGLPFPECSVHRIYSSHFLEHLSYREGQVFLKQCLKALVPGGVFSISVPDAQLFFRKYAEGTGADPGALSVFTPWLNGTTGIDYLNYIAYMDGQHKYMFDAENLLHILKKAGFEKVSQRGFCLGLDPAEREHQSIYAEAYKPA